MAICRIKGKAMKVLMVGPCPPPRGGVANFIKNIVRQKVLKDIKFQVHRIGRREYEINLFKQVFIEILDLFYFINKSKFRNADIIHIHTSSYWSFYRSTLYFFIVNYLSNAKIIIHIHGAMFDSFYENSFFIFKKLIRHVFLTCNTIIVTSTIWIPMVKKIIRCNGRVYILYNGFDNSLFKPIPVEVARESIHEPKYKKILLNIGNLEKYKGQKYFIDVMKIIIRKRSDVSVYIIGDGPLKKELRDKIKLNKLDKYIILLGKISDDEISVWINSCNVFVLPSLAEGNPTVMFEALGCGKPFVGTKVGGVPEIISSDDYGFVVEPANPKELAEKILIALDKEWDNEKIGRYAQRFTWQNISKDLLNIYKNTK